MLYNIINKAKNVIPKGMLFWSRFNQDISLKKKVSKKDLNYLDKKEVQDSEIYWRKYTKKYNVDYCSYYSSRTEKFDKNYIPDNLYYSYIDNHFNNSKKSHGIDDKNYYDKFYPDIKQPQTLLRKINGHYYDSNYNFKKYKDLEIIDFSDRKYILKPSIESESKGGKGIVFIDDMDEDKIKELLLSSNDYIIQEQVKQNELLGKIHPSSLNTIRVVSLFFKEEVHIISSVLRIGLSGSKLDNASAGGIVVGIDEDGYLKDKAYSSKNRNIYTSHPDTGVIFKGYKVPSFDKVLDIVKQEAIKLPDFRMVAWDFAIDENRDVIFIEFNLKDGQLDFHQFTNGPFFGDLTDEVLEEVFLG